MVFLSITEKLVSIRGGMATVYDRRAVPKSNAPVR
jgi:hypothetical protein